MGRSRWFFVLIVVGIMFVLVGIATGASSHSSTYRQIAKSTIAHYLSADGTGYLQLDSGPDLYIVHEGNFTPAVNGTNTFQDGDTVSLVADPQDTTNIDKTSTIGTHLVGSASNVVQIIAFDDNTGQPKTTYATSAYNANQNGYTQNNWGVGGILIVLGLLMAVGAFFLPRRKPQPSFGVTPGIPGMGQQQMTNPYNAPYQGVPPYPGQFGQSGQQLPPYQQPPSPYSGANNSYAQPQYPTPPPQPGQTRQPRQQFANPYGTPHTQYPPQPPQTGYEPTQRADPPGPGGYEPTQRANPYE